MAANQGYVNFHVVVVVDDKGLAYHSDNAVPGLYHAVVDNLPYPQNPLPPLHPHRMSARRLLELLHEVNRVGLLVLQDTNIDSHQGRPGCPDQIWLRGRCGYGYIDSYMRYFADIRDGLNESWGYRGIGFTLQIAPHGSAQEGGFADAGNADDDRDESDTFFCFRHMSRDFNRLERQLSRGSGPNLGSLVDRSYPVMPQFVEESGRKLARFHFDVGGFKPEDVSITIADNKAIITAKHEDKGEDHHAIREFRRMVQIAQGVQFEQMKSRLTPDGVLTIEAPFNPPAIQQNQHHEIPISHETRK
ncbi:uncharacterized protein LOC129583786 [Paramacrobiotus metropolitanus]|uniref:uncharacterized protein LOC129583786 n=1 Tax=Paramacrobiotus metropolitanus TaxID=2943436 RepID=UPI002445FD84|nr:uncharacterized protein LOC129583786 [Paramacrobiotus metropolitanus]